MSYQFTFRPVRSGKVSELIAQQVKEAIFAGAIKTGEQLPSERELGQRFQASRNSVREALKILEVSGLLTIKRGAGVFVTDVTSRTVTDSFSLMLKTQKVSMNELTQARIVFEPGMARLACEGMTGEHIRELKANVARTEGLLEAGQAAAPENIRFHMLIAEATQNTVISLTMQTLFELVREAGTEITRSAREAFAGSRRALACHGKILQAFQDKDRQRAYDLMLEHVLEIQEALLKELRQRSL